MSNVSPPSPDPRRAGADYDDDDEEAEFEDFSMVNRDQLPDAPAAGGEAQRVSEADDDDDLALFGEDRPASDHEDEDAALFGKDDDEDDDLDAQRDRQPQYGDDAYGGTTEDRDEEGMDEDAPEPVDVNVLHLPSLDASLKVQQLDLPTMLRVEAQAFDPNLYEGLDPETVDEHELRLHLESTVRWRYMLDEHNNTVMDSNARLVQWSDGSWSIVVGDELLDVTVAPNADFQHLAQIQAGPGILVTEAALPEKLLVKPSGVGGGRALSAKLAAADKFKRTGGTKVVDLDHDPDEEHARALKAEQEKLKAQRRMESRKRQVAGRYGAGSRANRRNSRSQGDDYDMDDEDLEEEDLDAYGSDDDGGASKSRPRRSGRSNAADADDLGDFVVNDDEDVVQYTAEDDEEELERATRLMDARRGAGRNRVEKALSQRRASDVVDDDGEGYDDAAAAPRSSRRRTAAVLSDDDD
ncbi:Paf1 complex component [Blastocladiella emersonii ATCC 22665]|nr:Paf1 complex component [Blastocladiella emersonii ATCC 22665]